MISLGSRRVPDFAAVRAHAAAARRKDEIPPDSVFVNVRTRLSQEIAEGRRAVVAAFTAGSRERLGQLLADAKVIGLSTVENWDEVTALPPEEIALTILPIEAWIFRRKPVPGYRAGHFRRTYRPHREKTPTRRGFHRRSFGNRERRPRGARGPRHRTL